MTKVWMRILGNLLYRCWMIYCYGNVYKQPRNYLKNRQMHRYKTKPWAWSLVGLKKTQNLRWWILPQPTKAIWLSRCEVFQIYQNLWYKRTKLIDFVHKYISFKTPKIASNMQIYIEIYRNGVFQKQLKQNL